MNRILSDSTNASSGTKSSALSTVLSLTHALSNSSPTKSFSPTFPLEDMAESTVDSVQKPNAKPGKRHLTCLALLKPSNPSIRFPSSSGSICTSGPSTATQSAFAQENSLGSKKRQKVSSVPASLLDIPTSHRSKHGTLPFPSRKRASSGLVSSKPSYSGKPKSRTTSSANRPKIAYTTGNKPSPLPSPVQRSAKPPSHSDLAFMEVTCKSVIHHWSHVIDLEGSEDTVYDFSAMDRELVKRINDSLLKNGRRGALLAIAKETMEKTAERKWRQSADVDLRDGQMSMDVDENVFFDDADDDEDDDSTSGLLCGSSRRLPPLTGLRSIPIAFPTLTNSDDQDIDFPMSCSEPRPENDMHQIPVRVRNDSLLLPSRSRSSSTRSRPISTPSKASTSHLSDPKPLSHIVAFGILRQRNQMRPRRSRAANTSGGPSISSASGSRPSPLSSSTTAEAVDFGFGYPVTIYSYRDHPAHRPSLKAYPA